MRYHFFSFLIGIFIFVFTFLQIVEFLHFYFTLKLIFYPFFFCFTHCFLFFSRSVSIVHDGGM
jgi:hypothetical protein